jgi:hypothetical protein
MLMEGEEGEEGNDGAVHDGDDFAELEGESCGPGLGEEVEEPGVDQGGQEERKLGWEE